MKTKAILFVILLLILGALATSSAADGTNQYGNTQNQTYPVPNLYPIGQYTTPYSQPNQQTPQQQQPQYQYYYQQPQYQYNQNQQQWQYPCCQPTPTPQYQEPHKQKPDQYKRYNDPYYDPYSGMYFYRIEEDKPQYTYPYQQPYSGWANNVQVYKQWSFNGSINLTWTITNTTYENWPKSNVDIKCISGCHLLTDPYRTLWDIPYTVNRGGQLSFTVNIWQPMYGESMTFAMVAGSKTLYTFNVNPN